MMQRRHTDERAASNFDRVFFALADPTRRNLLDKLYARDGQRLRELISDFDISRQAVSKHLEVLADTGLIFVRRGECGAPVHFLNRALIRQVHRGWIEKFLRVDVRVDCS